MNPIAKYYADKEAEAARWQAELDAAKKAGAPPETIRRIERRLEQARYVGD